MTECNIYIPSENIFEAVNDENINDIKKYLDSGIDINIKNEYGLTPLSVAIRTGNKAVINFLLGKKETEVHIRDREGNTPFYYAVLKGDFEMVKSVFINGKIRSTFVPRNLNGNTIIMASILSGSLKTLKSLVLNGLWIGKNDQIDMQGNNLIIYSALAPDNNLDILKFILETGVDMDKIEVLSHKNKMGQTSISLSVCKNNLPYVKFLIDKGVKYETTVRSFFNNVIDRYNNENIMELILDNNAFDINKPDNDGNTIIILTLKELKIIYELFTCRMYKLDPKEKNAFEIHMDNLKNKINILIKHNPDISMLSGDFLDCLPYDARDDIKSYYNMYMSKLTLDIFNNIHPNNLILYSVPGIMEYIVDFIYPKICK